MRIILNMRKVLTSYELDFRLALLSEAVNVFTVSGNVIPLLLLSVKPNAVDSNSSSIQRTTQKGFEAQIFFISS